MLKTAGDMDAFDAKYCKVSGAFEDALPEAENKQLKNSRRRWYLLETPTLPK